MASYKKFPILFFILLFSAYLNSQDVRAKKIINDYVKVIGGKENLEKIRTLSYTYEMFHKIEKKKFVNKIFQKKDNLIRYEFKENKEILIVNKNESWRKKYDPQTRRYSWESGIYDSYNSYILTRFGQFLDYEKRGIAIEYISQDQFNDYKYHKLKMIFPNEETWLIYFDVKTKFWVLFEPAPGMRFYIKRYQRYGKYILPTITEGKGTLSGGKNWHHINTIKNMRINRKLKDSLFIHKE